jgi:2-dehydropantoate 2-reductase
MRILIVGAGALGGYFGARLFDAGADICLYERDSLKVETIANQGFVIAEADGSRRLVFPPIFSEIGEAGPVDLIILLVKAYHTQDAAKNIAQLSSCAPDILSLQNGMGNLETLAGFFPRQRLFGGVTYQAAFEESPGKILHTGSGQTVIAPVDPNRFSVAKAYAAQLSKKGLVSEAVGATELEVLRWQKLLVNSAINPISAIHRLLNGALIEDAAIRTEMAALAQEGVAVAESQGFKFDFDMVWARIVETCQKTAANRSSMLCDVEQGRKTEIDAINGGIVALGAKKGIATPAQKRIISLLKAHYPEQD